MPQIQIATSGNLLDHLQRHPRFQNNPLTIGVVGGSGAGKNHITTRVLAPRLEVQVLDSDDYYKGKDLTPNNNFDAPTAVELSLLTQHLSLLKERREIQKGICKNSASSAVGKGRGDSFISLLTGVYLEPAEPVPSVLTIGGGWGFKKRPLRSPRSLR